MDRLIAALRAPACYPHAVEKVELLQTHISCILLAGDYAYKIKKPVNLGFLDFSTLAADEAGHAMAIDAEHGAGAPEAAALAQRLGLEVH